MKINELNDKLTALGDQVSKIITEVQTLKDSLTNVDLPADAQASLDKLTGLVQQADDLNTDAIPPTPPAV